MPHRLSHLCIHHVLPHLFLPYPIVSSRLGSVSRTVMAYLLQQFILSAEKVGSLFRYGSVETAVQSRYASVS